MNKILFYMSFCEPFGEIFDRTRGYKKGRIITTLTESCYMFFWLDYGINILYIINILMNIDYTTLLVLLLSFICLLIA